MKFTSHIIVLTTDYVCYMIYGKGREPNNRREDLHIIQLESYVGQMIKGYGYERNKNYIKQNTGYLNLNFSLSLFSSIDF